MTGMGNEVVKQDRRREDDKDSIEVFLQKLAPEMQRALPATMNGDRIARIALTLVRRNPKLGLCVPQSFAAALMTSAALGLEPGVNDESYLVPYGRECTLIVGYQGMLKLAWNHPLIQDIGSGFVFPEDDFDYDLGMDTFVKHKPAKGVVRKPGDWPTMFYAWATLKTGGKHVVVLDRAEVKALRKGAEGPDASFKGGDPQHWLSRKTCIKQLLKPLPKSVEAHWATQVDEQTGSQLFVQQVPQQIAEQVEAPPERPALEVSDAAEPEGHYVTQAEAEALEDPWAVKS